jgi:hypothetical protein
MRKPKILVRTASMIVITGYKNLVHPLPDSVVQGIIQMIHPTRILLTAALSLMMSALTVQAANTQLATTQAAKSTSIPISALPFNIKAPGTYVLTGNLTLAPNGTVGGITFAITVDAPGPVTIDMRGFTLSSSPVQISPLYFITGAVNILSSNVTVMNGAIKGFVVGISADGYKASNVSPATFLSGIDLEKLSFLGGTQIGGTQSVLSVGFEFVNYGLVRNCDFRQQSPGTAIDDIGSATGNSFVNDKLSGLNGFSVVEPYGPLVDFALNLAVAK